MVLLSSKQHPDSIWTWSTSATKGRASLWVPYLSRVEKVKVGWLFVYNGGEFVANLSQVDTLLLYGASCDLPLAFLDALATERVPMLLHRRNLPHPYVFVPANRTDDADVLTAQVIARQNQTKCAYVARTLIAARFANVMFKPPPGFYKRLAKQRSVDGVRSVEAMQSRRYWRMYFDFLGMSDDHRRAHNPVSAALDAGSFFMYGVLLRWMLLHKLSPAHGYLHVTTGYPSLVYDLMEPYRYIFEAAVARAVTSGAKDLTAACLHGIKVALDEKVYATSHHVDVRRKNLLHGAVLALRAWLLGDTKRLVWPQEGERQGGRLPKTGYALPGSVGFATKKKQA